MIQMWMQYKAEDGQNGDTVEDRVWAMIGMVQNYLLRNLNMGSMVEARPLGKTKGMVDFNLQIIIYPGPTLREEPQDLRGDILHIMDDFAWPHERIFLAIERSTANWGITGGEL